MGLVPSPFILFVRICPISQDELHQHPRMDPGRLLCPLQCHTLHPQATTGGISPNLLFMHPMSHHQCSHTFPSRSIVCSGLLSMVSSIHPSHSTIPGHRCGPCHRPRLQCWHPDTSLPFMGHMFCGQLSPGVESWVRLFGT